MGTVVMDTDVVSFLFKKDTRARLFQRHLVGQQWMISFMTVAELELWALRHQWGATRKARLEQYLAKPAWNSIFAASCCIRLIEHYV
ncbi:MAG TPA: hypothetical protein VN688_03075 [Gemmataceae bacterium]|nr:hypothetical protein [Gemmataceae bacterium]